MAQNEQEVWALLDNLVTSEERSMAHWESCESCKVTPTCLIGRRLMSEHIEAQLAAKVYVDRRRADELASVG